MLTEFIKKFTDAKIIEEPVKIGHEYFLITQELKKIIAQIKTKTSFAGIPLCAERGKNFAPSLYLLKKLSKYSTKKITVDSKGEWMFICRKDVFSKSATKVGECKVDDYVLVENQHSECIGYGKFVGEGKGIIVEHLFDIGDFLRRERHKTFK